MNPLPHGPTSAPGVGWNPAMPWRSAGGFALLMGVAIATGYWTLLTGQESMFYRDFGLWAYPNAWHHRSSFWSAELPLWNPYNYCGLPFLAQWNTLVLYPGSLLYLLLPLPWSLNLFCLIHLWLAAVGMYLVVRGWTGQPLPAAVSGLGYALGGLTLHSLMWPNNLAALAWAPWVTFATRQAASHGRRWIPTAGAVGCLQMLSGAPEIILLTWALTGALSLASDPGQPFRPFVRIRRVLGVALAVAAASAAQLLPFLLLLGDSQRDAGYGDSLWSMPQWGWANYVVPLFGQTPSLIGVYSQDSQQWTSSYYTGIGILALALVGVVRTRDPRAPLLALFATGGFLLALGDHSPVYRLLHHVFPQLGWVRFPIKFVVLTSYALPLLAGFGLARLMRQTEPPERLRRVWAAALLGVGLLSGLALLHAQQAPGIGGEPRTTLHSCFSRLLLLSLIGALVWTLPGPDSRRPWLVGTLLLAALAVDLVTHTPSQNPRVPREAMLPLDASSPTFPALGQGRAMLSTETRAFLDRAATRDRLQYFLGHRSALSGNCNLIDRVAKLDGVFSLHLRDSAETLHALQARGPETTGGFLDFLGIKKVTRADEVFTWTNRPTARPLIEGGRPLRILTPDRVLDSLMAPAFDPAAQVYGITGPADAPVPPPMETRISEVVWSPNEITATVETGGPTFVSIAQAHHVGWRAHLDGARTPILRVNQAFQGVRVPAGKHRLALAYRDPGLGTGLLVSTLATLALAMSLRKRSIPHGSARLT